MLAHCQIGQVVPSASARHLLKKGSCRVSAPRYTICKADGQNGSSKAQRMTTFHKLIQEHGTVLVPGVYDALSAKILETQGHKSAFVSGYAVSATLLGEPDVGLLTTPEIARKAGQISAAVPNVCVIADADTGGGNVLNVQRTVKQLIAAGARGCFLEDQKWPKKSGLMRSKEVIGMEEHAAKIFAAREAAGSADFFIVARTDARATSAKYGLDDAITRANLYIDAGADASFVEAPRSDAELLEIGRRTKGIRVCNMHEGGVTPLHTAQEMRDMGFQVVLYPLTGLYAATRALMNVYKDLAEHGSSRGSLAQLVEFEEFSALMRLEEHYATEERFGRGEGQEKLHVRVPARAAPAEGS